MPCLAEIVSIGTELVTGQNLDTNSQWLSRRLAEIGVPVGWHTTIADDFDANLHAFRVALSRASVVLVTGGLGPTQDDLTRDVLAAVAGVELVFDPATLAHIEGLFRSRNRVMPERNRVQAMFPKGSEILFNGRGTAPGIWMSIGDAVIAAMPGVPSEMVPMFEDSVRPRLARFSGGAIQIERKINTFGGGESHVEEKLGDLTRRGNVPEVGITASDAIISLRIVARAASLDEANRQIDPVEQIIRQRLGDWVYGVDNETLAAVVVRRLKDTGRTLATAESLTAGLVGHRLAQIPGASDVYKGGVITYTDEAKTALLGVPDSLLKEHTAVSGPVAEAMAAGVRERLGADFAVSTTGYAGPTGDPVGLVYVGLAWPGGVDSISFHWFGTRTEVQSRTASLALNRVRLALNKL